MFSTVVYGSHIPTVHKLHWTKLSSFVISNSNAWLVAGDFNALLNENEKIRGFKKRSNISKEFVEWTMAAELHDAAFKGPKFTWQRGILFERLDKALSHNAWKLNFSEGSSD